MLSSSHTFALADLLPPAPNVERDAASVSAASVAVFGQGLPSSSTLHFALNHLRRAQDQAHDDHANRGISEKAKGKRRAFDEDDDLHAALHDHGGDDDGNSNSISRLSRNAPERHVLVLTHDLPKFRAHLAEENDVSLFGRSVDAATSKLLDRITIKHLPTRAHLEYFLATCYDTSNPDRIAANDAYQSSTSATRSDPSYLPFESTLVILHNASDYLDDSSNDGCGIEGYASILALFRSTFSSQSTIPPLLALLESFATTKTLSILPLRLQPPSSKRRRTDHDTGDDEGEDDDDELEGDDTPRLPLKTVIERFFDAVCEVQHIPVSPTQLEYGDEKRFLVDLRGTKGRPDLSSWIEYFVQPVGEDDEDGEEEGGTRYVVAS
ncbi:hypothetical protein JCM10212_002078 [Sporobolomyces blumeae]